MRGDQEFMTTEEVATKAHTSVHTVRYWRKTGYGPQGFRLGRRVLYVAAEVNAWLEQLANERAAKGNRGRVA